MGTAKAAHWTVGFVRSIVAAAREAEDFRHERATNQREEVLQDKEIGAKDVANRKAEALLPYEVREAEIRVRKMESVETIAAAGSVDEAGLEPTRIANAEVDLAKSVERTPHGLELQEQIVRSPIENEDEYVREVRALTDATRAAARLENVQIERFVIIYVDYIK